MLATDLLPDPAAPGRLRSFPAGIKKSAYTPTAIPQLIEEMFGVMLDKVIQIPDPHEQGFFIMVHLPYLQPFEDVNKRVSRLAANISFNKHNLVPLSFIGVPDDLYILGLLGIYELNRTKMFSCGLVTALLTGTQASGRLSGNPIRSGLNTGRCCNQW